MTTTSSLPTPRSTIRVRPWLRRSLLGLSAATVALTATGLAYQSLGVALDQQRYSAPGEQISIGDHRLHIHEMGQHHDGPTVVLVSGLGVPSSGWAWIQSNVADFARVVSYDRAGLGWSEESTQPFDAVHTAQQLHDLLEAADIPGPYILVGHSIGGLYVRQFTDLYPDDVAGLVLVDASHPEQLDRLPKAASDMQLKAFKLYQASPWLARFGILRATNLHGRMMQSQNLPPEAQGSLEAFYNNPDHLKTMAQETRQWDIISDQVNQTKDLGNRPLTVLSANPEVESDQAPMLRAWLDLQGELADLSSEGQQQLVDGADHNSLLMNSDHARVVADAIHEVVMQGQD